MRATAAVLPVLVLLAAGCAQTPDVENCPMIESVATGEFWYRLDDENGDPQGYARLNLTTPEEGGCISYWRCHSLPLWLTTAPPAFCGNII